MAGATTPFPPVRSIIRMPSRSHPLSARIEDELAKLRAWSELAAAAAPKPESLRKALDCLAHLHSLVDEFLHLPASQQAIHRLRGGERVEELLGGYVSLLDASAAAREVVAAVRERAVDVLSALRRRGADVAVAPSVDAYLQYRKNSKKVLSKCMIKVVKQRNENCCLPRQALSKEDFRPVVGLLIEVGAVSATILRSLLQFLSPALNSRKWALVSKVVPKGRAQAGEEDQKQEEAGGGLSGSDAAIHELRRKLLSKSGEASTVRLAQRRLAKLDAVMEGLEAGLGAIFRVLIQNSVSLLNSLSL